MTTDITVGRRAPSTTACTHCLSPARIRRPVDAPLGPASYGRMFPALPSLDVDEEFLRAIGGIGGLCDCGDGDDTPESLAHIPAGWAFFGQFVAHDITADRSPLQHHADADQLRNARSAQLDLQNLYGDGPVGNPFLYQRDDPAKFLLGANGADVQRNTEGIAIIGDPRNDSYMVISQLHLAMLKAHNRFVDDLRQRGTAESDIFRLAARETLWHYQWIISHEFLPKLVGQELVDDVRTRGPRWFRPRETIFIPLEFADAAYRYGHAQIRHQYRLNNDTEPVPIFPDLLGFRPVPSSRVVDWSLLFDAPEKPPAQRAKKIDARLVRCLIELPVAITGESDVDEYHSLAVRDLERGEGVGLPSGEAIARHAGIPPLTADEIELGATTWRGETPLWYYILREAAVRTGGERLGPIGGRIVAEVVLTILQLDPTSVNSDPHWRPRASLIDLLLERPSG